MLRPLVGAFHHWCASDFVQTYHAAVMRRASTSATTPEHANTMATVKGSQALPPVCGSESAGGAEAEAFALAEALAVALAVAPVLALSCTRRTSRLSA